MSSLTKMQIATIGWLLTRKNQRVGSLSKMDALTYGRAIKALKARGLITSKGCLTRGAIERWDAYKASLEKSEGHRA